MSFVMEILLSENHLHLLSTNNLMQTKIVGNALKHDAWRTQNFNHIDDDGDYWEQTDIQSFLNLEKEI